MGQCPSLAYTPCWLRAWGWRRQRPPALQPEGGEGERGEEGVRGGEGGLRGIDGKKRGEGKTERGEGEGIVPLKPGCLRKCLTHICLRSGDLAAVKMDFPPHTHISTHIVHTCSLEIWPPKAVSRSLSTTLCVSLYSSVGRSMPPGRGGGAFWHGALLLPHFHTFSLPPRWVPPHPA